MIVSEATLREAAFQLLASSTARRYIREAGRIAVESGLVDALRSSPARVADAQARALELLAQLQREAQRSPAEFEAAIVLCALARIDAAGEAPVLERAAGVPSPWIRVLGLRLLQLGPPTPDDLVELETQLAAVLTGDVIVTPINESDKKDPAVFPRAA